MSFMHTKTRPRGYQTSDPSPPHFPEQRHKQAFTYLVLTSSIVLLYMEMWKDLVPLVVAVLLAISAQKTRKRSNVVAERVLLAASQASLLEASLRHGMQGNAGLLCLVSTLICCLGELQTGQPKWLRVGLLGKHVTIWAWTLGRSQVSAYGLANAVEFTLIYGFIWVLADSTVLSPASPLRPSPPSDKEQLELASILSAAPDVLVVLSSNLGISHYNSQALEVFQVESSLGLASRLTELSCETGFDEGEGTSLLVAISAFMKDEYSNEIALGITQINQQFYQWKAAKFTANLQKGCILLATDVTDLTSTCHILKEESENKSSVLRFASHELRTPANAILNLSSNVLEGGRLQAEDQMQVAVVVTSTHFLLAVVNDLLDLTRMTSDRFALVKQSFDLRKEVKDTVGLIELQCRQKGLSLKANFDPLIPELVYSDPSRLKQVVLNLLSNALKFTFSGGIRLICMLTSHNTLKLTVSDTGVGIPSNKISSLCQVFGQVEGTQRINPQGCGLGLYISNLIALSLGSKPIQIQSKLGLGSEFSFEVNIFQEECALETIPYVTTETIGDEQETQMALPATAISSANAFENRPHAEILVVDDSEFNRMVLLKILESMNVIADEAASGLRALAKIRDAAKRQQFYRIIFMDVEMPEMDGLTATQEIRTMELMGELQVRPRIVCCSAHRSMEDVDRSMTAGMDHYLEKPINRVQLQDLVFQLR